VELDLWGSNDGLENDTVPAVDSGDLKKVWLLLQESRGVAIGEESAIGLGSIERICNSGVNVRAVWYRASLLLLPSERSGLLSRWTSEGTPIDAVFKVAAVFPVEKLQLGVVHSGMPFDVTAFLQAIEKESQK